MSANLKMMTGLAAKLGLGPPLRLLAFVVMCWPAWWWIASGSAAGMFAWVQDLARRGNPSGMFAILVVGIVFLAGVFVAFVLAEEHKWKMPDMLRRAPFLLWCGITDDNETVSLWMILFWPLLAAADFVVSICLVVAAVAVGVFKLLGLKVWGK